MEELLTLIKEHKAEFIASIISVISLIISILSFRERRISSTDKIRPFVFPIIGPMSTYVEEKEDKTIFLIGYLDEEKKENLGYQRLKIVCLNSHAFQYKYSWHYDIQEYISLLEKHYGLKYSSNKKNLIFENFEVLGTTYEFGSLDISVRERNARIKHFLKVNEEINYLHFPETILEIITLIHVKLGSEPRTRISYPPVYLKQEFADLRGRKNTAIFKVELFDFIPTLFEQKLEGYKCLTTIVSDVHQVKKIPSRLKQPK